MQMSLFENQKIAGHVLLAFGQDVRPEGDRQDLHIRDSKSFNYGST
jgi:hypothetical protein